MPNAISGYTCEELIVAGIYPVGYKASNYSGEIATHLNFLFNKVYLKFCNFYNWRFITTSTAITLASGSFTHDLLASSVYAKQIYSLWVTEPGFETKILPREYEFFRNNDILQTNTGTPNFYGEFGGTGKLIFDAAPTQNLSALIAYDQVPQLVTDFDTYTILPRDYQYALKDLFSYEIAKEKKDVGSAELKKVAQESLEEVLMNEQNKLDVGDRMFGEGDVLDSGRPTMNDYLRGWFD